MKTTTKPVKERKRNKKNGRHVESMRRKVKMENGKNRKKHVGR
jgi:hypothetical protein